MSTAKGLQQLLQRFGRTYAKNQCVFEEGDQGDEVFFLVKGRVEVTLKDRLLCTLGPGDVFGEMALFNEAPRSASVSVLEPVEAIVFDSSNLYTHITLYPELAVRLLKLMTQRMERMDKDLKEALSATAYDNLQEIVPAQEA